MSLVLHACAKGVWRPRRPTVRRHRERRIDEAPRPVVLACPAVPPGATPRGSPRSFAYWPWARRNAAFFASRARRSSYEEDAARAQASRPLAEYAAELKDEIVVV